MLFAAAAAAADTHWVTNAADFNSLPTLNAGDRVVLLDGDYGALDTTLTSSIADDMTAQTNPVIVYAETPGGANVTAPSKILLEGRGITLAGLDFVSGSGMIDNGSSSTTYLIRLAADSRHMTLSNIRFKDCTSGDDYGSWILMNGFNNTIEYCTFEGKDEPNANATIAVYRSPSEAGTGTPRNHVIRRCYFGPREVSTSDNGYESIRIGTSSTQAYSMHVTVEENVFYRAIWRTDGQKGNDPEIISNKSADNVIRDNTFLESQGQISLRHGDRALVEGNYIFGGGRYAGTNIVIASTNTYQGGVRVIGTDHIVRNNYFQNLQGTDGRAALVIVQGVAGFDEGDGTYGDNTYEAAHNAKIYNNTFVGCKQINLGFPASGTSVQPTNAVFYNNAWQGVGSSEAVVRESGFKIGASSDNYIYEPNGNYGWTGLINGTYTDSISPAVTDPFDNYLIPANGSPLLDDALASVVSNDVRGLSRLGATPDIGCFEREVSGTGNRPLLRNEVGPQFDGGPWGTYPVQLLDPDLPPSGNFDLTQYYLTMPVDSTNGYAGEATNISTAALAGGYENAPWFYTGTNGTMVFAAPWNGAIRGTSTSPRCELRETYADGSLRNWTPLDDGGLHTLSAVCTVDSVGDGKVSIGQIHGKVPQTATVILRYDNTVDPAEIYASVYRTPDGTQGIHRLYFDAPALGEQIDYQLKMTGTDSGVDFECTVNGNTQSMALTNEAAAWKEATFYFKAGAYYTNPDEGSTAQVSFYKLELSRGASSVTPAILPNGSVGKAYSQTLAVASPDVGWSVVDGALPDGLSLSTGGVISGTPTATGVSLFTVAIADVVQPFSLAIDKAPVLSEQFSEDFEKQPFGQQPTNAATVRPTSNDADNLVEVVSGQRVRFYDNDSSEGSMLTWNFVGGSNEQASVVRVDFTFEALDDSGTGDDFVAVGVGEYSTAKTFNKSINRFVDARLYDDGTIDFRNSVGAPTSTGNDLQSGTNTLTFFANDYDSQSFGYTGPDGSNHVLAADSVAYWLNGSLIDFSGEEYTSLDTDEGTAGGTVGTTENNLGKFGFNTTSADVGLDYTFDDIVISILSAADTESAARTVVGVSASSSDGNLPENTLDGSLTTRWSAFGDGQWIVYDLGVPQNLHEVRIAFYQGNVRSSDFEVEVSIDGQNWASVLSLQSSSGTTTELESFAFAGTSGRYLRIVGYGNSSNDWNSFTEVEILGVAAVIPTEIISPDIAVDSGEAIFTVPSVYGAAYQLERTDSLVPVSWENVGPVVPGTGGDLLMTDPVPLADERFYRLRIQP